MLKEILILFFAFYFLTLVQTGFFIHFRILNQVPNLILVFLFLIIFFDQEFLINLFFLETILAGFFLDLISSRFLGISIIILFLGAFFLKKILKSIRKQNIFSFIFLFLAFTFLYEETIFIVNCLLGGVPCFAPNQFLLIRVAYSLLFAILGFYLCLIFQKKKILGVRR